MTAKKPPSLVSSVLVRKGDASPTAYTATRQPAFAPVLVGGSQVKTSGNLPARRTARTQEVTDHVRISVRMDVAEHLRLKLAAAHTQRSMSDVVAQALNDYIDRLAPGIEGGHCRCLESSEETLEKLEPAEHSTAKHPAD
jgi:hypothetical protein